MAKRKQDCLTTSSKKIVRKPAKSSKNPSLSTPFTDTEIPKIADVAEDIISFKCKGCGKSGNHPLSLESGYRLVKTAMLVEVGTQTGDGSMLPEIEIEDTGLVESLRLMDPNNVEKKAIVNNDSLPATSASSPISVSSGDG